MRSLKALFKKENHVWIACESDDLQKCFLEQAEDEGFICLNGQNPTEMFHRQFYGIDQNMSVGYVSAMNWFLSAKCPGHVISTLTGEYIIDPFRVDYGKYIAGEEDYFIHMHPSKN